MVLVNELEVWRGITDAPQAPKSGKDHLIFTESSRVISSYPKLKMEIRMCENDPRLLANLSASEFSFTWRQCVPLTPTQSLHALLAHTHTLDVAKPQFPTGGHTWAAQDHTSLSSRDSDCRPSHDCFPPDKETSNNNHSVFHRVQAWGILLLLWNGHIQGRNFTGGHEDSMSGLDALLKIVCPSAIGNTIVPFISNCFDVLNQASVHVTRGTQVWR